MMLNSIIRTRKTCGKNRSNLRINKKRKFRVPINITHQSISQILKTDKNKSYTKRQTYVFFLLFFSRY